MQLAAVCTWPSRKYLREETDRHYMDWVEETRIALSQEQFNELALLVIAAPRSEVWFYKYKGRNAQFAIMADIRMLKSTLRNVGLIIDPQSQRYVGLWRIKKKNYFGSQPDSYRISDSR